MLKEKANQGIESLIHPTDFSQKFKMPLPILQFRKVPGDAKGTAGDPGLEAEQETTVFDWFWSNSALWFPWPPASRFGSLTPGQGVQSLIHSTDWPTETVFCLGKMQPGCRILDTFARLAARNHVLPKENTNQNVESLILSHISKENHQFS